MSNMNMLYQQSKRSWHLKPNSLIYIYLTLTFDSIVILAISVQIGSISVKNTRGVCVTSLNLKQILSIFDLDL